MIPIDEASKASQDSIKTSQDSPIYLPSLQVEFAVLYEAAQSKLKDSFDSFAEGLEALKKLAERGHHHAQRDLGIMFAYGFGVEKNTQEAIKWLTAPSIFGIECEEELLELALLYLKLEDDSLQKKGIEILNTLSKRGNARASYEIAMCYWKGRGVEKDQKKALELFEKELETREPYCLLEQDYYACKDELEGRTKPRMHYDLKVFLMELANHLISSGLPEMTVMKLKIILDFLSGGELYRGSKMPQIIKDKETALLLEVKQLKKQIINLRKIMNKDITKNQAVMLEFSWTAVIFGVCCFHGLGLKENPSKGLQFLQESAGAGNAAAATYLGWIYLHGVIATVDEKHPYRDANGAYYAKNFSLLKDIMRATSYFVDASKKGFFEASLGVIICHMFLATDSAKDNLKALESLYLRSDPQKGGHKILKQYIMMLEKSGDPEKEKDSKLKNNIKRILIHNLHLGYSTVFLKDADYQSQPILIQPRAFNYYRKAAQHEEWEAVYKLGTFYEAGIGFDKDLEMARQCYIKAASHVEPNAILKLVKSYSVGCELVARDPEKAFALISEFERRKFGHYIISNETSILPLLRDIASHPLESEKEKKLMFDIFFEKSKLLCEVQDTVWKGLDIMRCLAKYKYIPAILKLSEFYGKGFLVKQDYTRAWSFLKIANHNLGHAWTAKDKDYECYEFYIEQIKLQKNLLNANALTKIIDLSLPAREFLKRNLFLTSEDDLIELNYSQEIRDEINKNPLSLKETDSINALDLSESSYDFHFTPLVRAINLKNHSVIQELLACKDIDVNKICYRCDWSETRDFIWEETNALVEAIGLYQNPKHLQEKLSGDSLRLATLLVAHGADVNAIINGETILSRLFAMNLSNYYETYLDMINLLLRAKADPNKRNCNGSTVLFQVARFPNAQQILELLLQHGLNIDCCLPNGFTPLHNAVFDHIHNHDWHLKFYIAAGIKVEARDGKGKTAREYLIDSLASETHLLGLCTTGRHAKAHADEQTTKKLKILELAENLIKAVQDNDIERARVLLLKESTFVNIRDLLGNTLLQIARLNQNLAMQRLLLRSGAKYKPNDRIDGIEVVEFFLLSDMLRGYLNKQKAAPAKEINIAKLSISGPFPLPTRFLNPRHKASEKTSSLHTVKRSEAHVKSSSLQKAISTPNKAKLQEEITQNFTILNFEPDFEDRILDALIAKYLEENKFSDIKDEFIEELFLQESIEVKEALAKKKQDAATKIEKLRQSRQNLLVLFQKNIESCQEKFETINKDEKSKQDIQEQVKSIVRIQENFQKSLEPYSDVMADFSRKIDKAERFIKEALKKSERIQKLPEDLAGLLRILSRKYAEISEKLDTLTPAKIEEFEKTATELISEFDEKYKGYSEQRAVLSALKNDCELNIHTLQEEIKEYAKAARVKAKAKEAHDKSDSEAEKSSKSSHKSQNKSAAKEKTMQSQAADKEDKWHGGKASRREHFEAEQKQAKAEKAARDQKLEKEREDVDKSITFAFDSKRTPEAMTLNIKGQISGQVFFAEHLKKLEKILKSAVFKPHAEKNHARYKAERHALLGAFGQMIEILKVLYNKNIAIMDAFTHIRNVIFHSNTMFAPILTSSRLKEVQKANERIIEMAINTLAFLNEIKNDLTAIPADKDALLIKINSMLLYAMDAKEIAVPDIDDCLKQFELGAKDLADYCDIETDEISEVVEMARGFSVTQMGTSAAEIKKLDLKYYNDTLRNKIILDRNTEWFIEQGRDFRHIKKMDLGKKATAGKSSKDKANRPFKKVFS